MVWDRRTGRARLQRDRVAGHPHPASDRRPARGRRRRRALHRPRSGCPSPPTSRHRRSRGSSTTCPAHATPAEAGDLLFGTTDTWVRLEPHRRRRGRRPCDRRHEREPHDAHGPARPSTGPTSCSPRWGVPRSMLPEIRSSSEVYGVGERCLGAADGTADRRHPRRPAGRDLRPGRIRRGRVEEHLRHGQLPARQHRRRDRPLEERAAHHRRVPAAATQPVHYALEGSIAVTGSLVQWLRDNLGLISSASEASRRSRAASTTTAARTSCRRSRDSSPRTGVPTRAARSSGLTRYVNKGHIARAALEAIAFQTRDVVEAVNADAGIDLSELRVDGGMTAQRHPAAVPGRHPRRAGRPSGRRRDDRARRGVRGRARDRVLVEPRRAPRALAGGRALRRRRCGEAERERRTAAGRRPSRRRSTGSTTTWSRPHRGYGEKTGRAHGGAPGPFSRRGHDAARCSAGVASGLAKPRSREAPVSRAPVARSPGRAEPQPGGTSRGTSCATSSSRPRISMTPDAIASAASSAAGTTPWRLSHTPTSPARAAPTASVRRRSPT